MKGVPWRDEEIEFLRDHYVKKGAAWCAEQLGRTQSAVQGRASTNGIAMAHVQGQYKSQEAVIEEMYMAGIGVGVIADTLGLKAKVLSARIGEWGLYEVRELHWADLAREIAAKHGIEVADA